MLIYPLLFSVFLFFAFLGKIKRYYKHNKQGWKVEKLSYKLIHYSEKFDGKWKYIEIDANITIGTFEPFFKSKKDWKAYPAWAQNRPIIMERVSKKYPLKNEISLIGVDDD